MMVRHISDIQLRNARITSLSACSTAENRVTRPADEVIYLASGFQVAGFAHVIGSMWSSSDEICVEIAKEFYRQLTIRPGNESGNKDVAPRDIKGPLSRSKASNAAPVGTVRPPRRLGNEQSQCLTATCRAYQNCCPGNNRRNCCQVDWSP